MSYSRNQYKFKAIILQSKIKFKNMYFNKRTKMKKSWTVKKAECQIIDAFELWCWRRLLRIPWTARRSNQSILREISPEYSLEGLMLKLKLQHIGHLMQTADSLEKTLMLGKIEGRRRRGHQRIRCLDGMTNAMDMNLGKLWEMVKDREACMLRSMGSELDTEGQLNKTTTVLQCSAKVSCHCLTGAIASCSFQQDFPIPDRHS